MITGKVTINEIKNVMMEILRWKLFNHELNYQIGFQFQTLKHRLIEKKLVFF